MDVSPFSSDLHVKLHHNQSYSLKPLFCICGYIKKITWCDTHTIFIWENAFENITLEMSFCLSLNVLNCLHDMNICQVSLMVTDVFLSMAFQTKIQQLYNSKSVYFLPTTIYLSLQHLKSYFDKSAKQYPLCSGLYVLSILMSVCCPLKGP